MNIKNLAIGIAIMILTLFVVMYGINIFYSQPEYEDFCNMSKPYYFTTTEKSCIEAGGRWEKFTEPQQIKDANATGYCDQYYHCSQDFETADKEYHKNIFLLTLPLGIIILLIGMFLFRLEAVGSGLMGGGILSIIYGIGGYWRYSAEVLKFSLSLAGLIIIIFAAYKYNKTGSFVFKKKRK